MKKLLLLLLFPLQALGAITYVGTGDRVQSAAPATINPPLPTNWAADDLCLLTMFSRDGGIPSFNTNGWTDATSFLTHTNLSSRHAQVRYRKMQSGDTSPDVTVTEPGPTAGVFGAKVTCFRGQDLTIPFDNTTTTDVTSVSTTMTAPTISTVNPNAWSIRIYISDEDNTHTTHSEGNVAYNVSNFWYAESLTYLNEASTGATGTATASQSQNGPSETFAITLAIRPAGTTPGAAIDNPSAQWDVNTRGNTNNDFYEHVDGNAETSTGSPTLDQNSVYDGLDYDGSNYTLLTKPPGLSNTFMNSDFTIAARIKTGTANPSVYENIFMAAGLANTPQRVHLYGRNSGGGLAGSHEVVDGTSGDDFYSSSTGDKYDGNEHVIAMRRIGNVFSFWADGSKIDQQTISAATQSSLGYIGLATAAQGTEYAWLEQFSGTIYWAAIWEDDLSDAEMAQLSATSNPWVTGGDVVTTWTDDTPTIGGTAIQGTLNTNFSGNITKCVFASGDELTASNADTNSADCATSISQLTPTGALNNTQIGVATDVYLANASETSTADSLTLGCPTGATCGTLNCNPLICRGDSLAREATNIAENDDFIIRFTSGTGTCNNSMVCEYTSATATVEWRVFDASATPDIWLTAETKNVETPGTEATTEDTIGITFQDCGDGTYREVCP